MKAGILQGRNLKEGDWTGGGLPWLSPALPQTVVYPCSMWNQVLQILGWLIHPLEKRTSKRFTTVCHYSSLTARSNIPRTWSCSSPKLHYIFLCDFAGVSLWMRKSRLRGWELLVGHVVYQQLELNGERCWSWVETSWSWCSCLIPPLL